jgi:hypothetical protein
MLLEEEEDSQYFETFFILIHNWQLNISMLKIYACVYTKWHEMKG